MAAGEQVLRMLPVFLKIELLQDVVHLLVQRFEREWGADNPGLSYQIERLLAVTAD